MLEALERHPNARAVLGAGAGARAAGPRTRTCSTVPAAPASGRSRARSPRALLAQGAPDPASAQARALAGAHPDLTWVVPSGAHEILVSDIDEPVVAAATRTPFESARRVFVIESAEQLGDEAANRLLKTLEEPASFVHLILITDRLADVLPTIRSRCQVVRFDAPGGGGARGRAVGAGRRRPRSPQAYARLSLGDAGRARELAAAEGGELRDARAGARAPGARGRGGRGGAVGRACSRRCGREASGCGSSSRSVQAAELELLPSRERKRAETEWDERVRRARRRVETGALELALDLVETWLLDLVGARRRGAPTWCATGTGWASCGPTRRSGAAAMRAALRRAVELGRGHAPALPAERQRGSRARGADLPARAGPGGVMAGLWHRASAS